MKEKKHDHAVTPNSRITSCGWGLTISGNGAYWTENPEEIEAARATLKCRLTEAG